MQVRDIYAEQIDRVAGMAWIIDESASAPVWRGVVDDRCEIVKMALIQLDRKARCRPRA